MSDSRDSQKRDYSLYDQMTGEALEDILRADYAGAAGETDQELMEHILEELLRRDRETAPESLPDVEESWAAFRASHFAAAESGERIGDSASARHTKRKIVRTLLIAAAIACFMSITAFAAFYFNMQYGPGPEEPKRYRIWDDVNESGTVREQWVEAQPTVVFNFSTVPEANEYYIRANWLPSEPDHAMTLLGAIQWEAKKALFQEGLSDEEITEERLNDATGRMLEEYGVTQEEAETWYSRYDTETMEDIPYQVYISSPVDLYNKEFRLGFAGSVVEIVRDETHDGLHEMRFTLDNSQTDHGLAYPQDKVNHLVNYILLYSEEEGYLIHIQGTLDMDTLARVAENLEVLKTGHIEVYEDNGMRSAILEIGRG